MPRDVFAGNQADVVPWLQALDVFALPSYANEGVPQALMQAMLRSCLASPPVGSIAELAKPDETALVVPPRDVPALRGALAQLLDDGVLRDRWGKPRGRIAPPATRMKECWTGWKRSTGRPAGDRTLKKRLAVVPAKAGTQVFSNRTLDPRFRGGDVTVVVPAKAGTRA